VSHKKHFLKVNRSLLYEKLNCLKNFWRSCKGPVAVGFSGGVDSSFLLITGIKWCNYPVYPFSLISLFLTDEAVHAIDKIALEIGIKPIKLYWNPLHFDKIRQNSIYRCYFCKKELYTIIKNKAQLKGCDIVVDGTHFGDLSKFRPGINALLENGIQLPLVRCKFEKDEIRFLLEKWKYSFWDKNAESCLATIFNYGYELNEEDFKNIGHMCKNN